MDNFITDCRAALSDSTPQQAIRETVERVVSDPTAIVRALGNPERGGIQQLHVADDLTILNVVWGPQMTLMPHNHNMWATIAVYAGREDNILWRRLSDDPIGRVEAAGAKSLGPGQVQPFGRDIIHSVTNPTSTFTGAIHVYGGDFFAVERSEWDPETLHERPYDVVGALKIFEQANARNQ